MPEVEVIDRRARRRLARRPVRVLRRDAVPDGRAAARAGDRVGRPPHGSDAARRRRGGRVLDADARGRGGRAGRLRRARRARGSAAARRRGSSARAGARWSSARGRWPGSRARPRTTSPATGRGCTSTCASCARPPAARWPKASAAPRLAREPRSPARPRRRARARGRARRAGSGARPRASRAAHAPARAGAARGSTLDAHDPQRTLERGYALVEDGPASRSPAAAGAARRTSCTIRLHDGRVAARIRRAPRLP